MARKILDSDGSGSEDGGTALQAGSDFKVNEDFARRFTHNKKREELRRLEDKLGSSSLKRKRDDTNGTHYESDDDSSTSESESEDDAGELATEALDSEILATLEAIRSKDPRVYDNETTFYRSIDEGQNDSISKAGKEKPMFLRDYHRETLLNGARDEDNSRTSQPVSYNQEQEALKVSIVGEITAAAASDNYESDEAQDNFLIKKSKPKVYSKPRPDDLDVENADKDPENFLSNFMTSRAWVPSTESKFQPFESDDEDEERRAEEFEQAYNFRFEDPDKANEHLRSHARDMAAQYSVRREEKNSRQKRRDVEREKKEAEKQELKNQKARLRKLKIEEMEEKVRRIKRAAGLKGKDLQPEEWSEFVDDDWDDAKWEEEMQNRFGDEYYADADAAREEDGDEESEGVRKIKKPRWDDDIDIKDIVPDFEEEDEAHFSLTDEDSNEIFTGVTSTKQKKDRTDRRKESKKERRIIEKLVDDQLSMDPTLLNGYSQKKGFRYRETSPTSFGLSSRDILLADDAQLKQFAGIKKLAAFRDPERKRKDRRALGKKARLREWRKETFGNENGLEETLLVHEGKTKVEGVDMKDQEGGVDIRTTGKKKRRRSKKSKTDVAEVE